MKRLLVILSLSAVTFGLTEGKKIRHSLKIEKETKEISTRREENPSGRKICLADTIGIIQEDKEMIEELKKVSFAGYDKEANSSQESFVLINASGVGITGYEVKIEYLDMQDRMLHSRTLKKRCDVPGGESRRFDIKSWDTQHTFYYYLGNEPKKVATPYKVMFYPLTFWTGGENS